MTSTPVSAASALRIWAVVPIKALSEAKSRLAPALDSAARRALVVAMLRHTLGVLQECKGLAGIVAIAQAVNTEAFRHIADLVADRVAVADAVAGVAFLAESGEAGLNGALEQASCHLKALGADGMLVIPGDLPLLRPDGIAAMLDLATPRGVVIAADRRGMGTNALLTTPPGVIPPCFGPDSFQMHREAALAVGIKPAILQRPDLALDVDLPEDLEQLPAGYAEAAATLFLALVQAPSR